MIVNLLDSSPSRTER